MSHDFTPSEIELAKERLGLTTQRLLFVFRASQLGKVQELLHDLINQTRTSFRQWLPQLHPDHNPGDPAKHRQFLVLAFVWSELKNLKDPEKAKAYWMAVQEDARRYVSPFRTTPSFAKAGNTSQPTGMRGVHNYANYVPSTQTAAYESVSDVVNQTLDAYAYGIWGIRPV